MWNFKIVHVPGKLIPASDTASRYPRSDSIDSLAAFRIVGEYDPMEEEIVVNNRFSLEKIRAVTWKRVRKATETDPGMLSLVHTIEEGFPNTCEEALPGVQPYWQHRDRLSVVEQVVMFGDRVVIPPSLRSEVCESLHAVHQGATGMSERAIAIVFWPEITEAIRKTREQCDSCWRMARSNPIYLLPVPMFLCHLSRLLLQITVLLVRTITSSRLIDSVIGLILSSLKRMFAIFGVAKELIYFIYLFFQTHKV